MAIVAVISFSCSASGKMSQSDCVITPLSENLKISDGALVYGLPMSVVDININAERVIEKPGPYSRYAEDLLGLTDVIKNEREYWRIKSITIRTHTELDPSQFYVIEANGFFHTNLLALKNEGLIMDLNPDIYNDFATGISRNSDENNLHKVLDLGADEYYREKKDTVYKVVSVDTAFIRIPYLVEKKQKLTVDQLAERAAKRLMEMRDGKHLILTGETNVFPQNEYALNEMNRIEKEYTDLFAGKIWKESHSFKYQLIPGKETSGRKITLCRFSESSGPVAGSESQGIPILVEFVPELKTRSLNAISKNPSNTQKSKNDKMYYRVPDVVNVRVYLANEVLSNARHLIYQFGEIVPLPANFVIGK